jgi:hypothetical protein
MDLVEAGHPIKQIAETLGIRATGALDPPIPGLSRMEERAQGFR